MLVQLPNREHELMRTIRRAGNLINVALPRRIGADDCHVMGSTLRLSDFISRRRVRYPPCRWTWVTVSMKRLISSLARVGKMMTSLASRSRTGTK